LESERRNEILTQNPPWLAAKGDRDEYLRGCVLINVYERFRIEILNRDAGVCLTLPVTIDEENG
jgi:hypothetical protein